MAHSRPQINRDICTFSQIEILAFAFAFGLSSRCAKTCLIRIENEDLPHIIQSHCYRLGICFDTHTQRLAQIQTVPFPLIYISAANLQCEPLAEHSNLCVPDSKFHLLLDDINYPHLSHSPPHLSLSLYSVLCTLSNAIGETQPELVRRLI